MSPRRAHGGRWIEAPSAALHDDSPVTASARGTLEGMNTPPPDQRLVLAYEEARSEVARQEGRLDNLRARAGTALAAASIAASFAGGQALDGDTKPDASAWFGMGGLVFVLVAAGAVLVPWPGWRFTRSARTLLKDYVDDGASLDEMHRQLAGHLEDDADENSRLLDRMNLALVLCLAGTVVEVLAFLNAMRR